jgi:hypothetical protein
MKRWCILWVLLAATALPVTGCSLLSGGDNWNNNIPQLKADIFMFSKLATRIALFEADMSTGDVKVVEDYLVAIRDLLVVPGQPDFTGARALVSIKLPPKYQIYGLTIIDVLERYLQTVNLNITGNQEAVISLVSSGIDGAIEAVQEFAD